MKLFTKTYFDVVRQSLANRRLLVVVGVLSSLFAGLSFFSDNFLIYFSDFFYMDLKSSSIPITFLLVSIVSLSLLYLQSGGNDSREHESKILYEKNYKDSIVSRNRLDHAISEISELKEKLALYESEKGLSEDEKQKIINGAVDQVSEEAIGKIFSQEATKLKELIKTNIGIDKLAVTSQEIVSRLRREISDLRLRSNINLVIGMAITAGGLYLLWSTVSMVDASVLLKQLASEGAESDGKFMKNLILPLMPRILLVIFVEIFAYFFLRLYKEGLSEIKYFQNELTNVESKLAAIEFSYITSQMDSLKVSLESLSNTERNFILEKGQTTVELEKAKSDSELTKNVIKTIPDLFKKSNK